MPEDTRLIALQERLSFAEHTIEILDGVVRELRQESDRLRQRVAALEAGAAASDPGRAQTGTVELPPHY
jgi:uncharacterized coiled-coil protein SlyX